MKKNNFRRLTVSIFAALLINTLMVGTSFAQSLASLKGTWVITLGGNTGAGSTAYQVVATLDKKGSFETATSNAVMTSSSVGSAIATTDEIFAIDPSSWNAKKRTAKASLTCKNMTNCAFNLDIQVSKNGQMFNVIDVTDSNQTLVGTGVKQ